MNPKTSAPISGAILASLLLWNAATVHAQAIEEIVVTADFRERGAGEIPASVPSLRGHYLAFALRVSVT